MQARVDARGQLPATGVLATALQELGDHEGAIALLAKAVAEHDAWLVVYNRPERYDKVRRGPARRRRAGEDRGLVTCRLTRGVRRAEHNS